MGRTSMTIEDRRKLEQMWNDGARHIQIAAELGISLSSLYRELRRGSALGEDGGLKLDKNFRMEYSAERGQATLARNRQNCGRRPAERPGGGTPHDEL